VPGVMIYNSSAIRKASLQMTENELLNAPKHIAEYKKTHSDLSDNEIGLLLVAVPEAMFHMTALAFILCHSWKDLCNVTKDKEVFREAVWGWWKDLEEAAWQKLIGISFVKMAAENVANDFTIKEEKDAPKPKN
jgi:hypothetical protein